MCSMLMAQTVLVALNEAPVAVLLWTCAGFAPSQHSIAHEKRCVMEFNSERGRLCSVLSLQ